jgi:hypothetical protein
MTKVEQTIKDLKAAMEDENVFQNPTIEVLGFEYTVVDAEAFTGTDPNGQPQEFIKLFAAFETESSSTEVEFLTPVKTVREIICSMYKD